MPTENKAFVLWLTDLSGSGKSTIAEKVYSNIVKAGQRIERLDGGLRTSLPYLTSELISMPNVQEWFMRMAIFPPMLYIL